jgi:hypothetical protein
MGLTEEEIQAVIEPQIAFHAQMKEEVQYYERIKRIHAKLFQLFRLIV